MRHFPKLNPTDGPPSRRSPWVPMVVGGSRPKKAGNMKVRVVISCVFFVFFNGDGGVWEFEFEHLNIPF